MKEDICPWCGKPIPEQLENLLEFPVRYKGKAYCPSCFQQLMHNTIV
ncbi:MAG: hypothetical protein ACOX7J_00535 [Bacillota bacterium]|jgi:hypothetical protein